MKKLQKIKLSGVEVYPIIEGGKGIGVSNGQTAGAFAAADAVGTLSGVMPPARDEEGNNYHLEFSGKTRKDRSAEIIQHSINGSVREIKTAYKVSGGKGRIHMNILWGIAGAETIIHEVLKQTKGMIHGITCGAGMPYRLAEIAAKYNVYYYPIVSSDRAFTALWNRSYKNVPDLLGGVVYEDPWKAGGHNGLTNKENPAQPEPPINRIISLRKAMNKLGREHVPIIMAGGVWDLKPFEDWIDNPEIAPIAFQLGTRPLLTKESPISEQWKEKLLSLQKGDVVLNKYSSTGFYSSAVKNQFMTELQERASRQIEYKEQAEEGFVVPFFYSKHKPQVYIRDKDYLKTQSWEASGYNKKLITPDETLLFVTQEKASEIQKDQTNCKGCLAACKFSSWSANPETNYSTGRRADPRSFCIFKTLENLICGHDIEQELLFSGHNSYNFAHDPLYKDGNVPTVKELIDTFISGN
ncbi:nitronate monooxygenase [Cytophagaceae bacterium ABcell3]|nr:nitronate monooxygenase [Cytophagaceae bacterium ABcell3]